MDYDNIRIPQGKLTRMHSFTASYKLKRLLFALKIYPDWKFASIFAGIERHNNFLNYWLEKDVVNLLLEDIKKRKETFSEDSEICTIIEHAFTKYCAGQNYLNPFLSDDEHIEEICVSKEPLLTQDEMIHYLGLEIDWSYEDIIENVDDLIEMERMRRNDAFVESGKYWIVAYRQIMISSFLRPFVLLVRVSEKTNETVAIQGVWPLTFMKKAIDKIIPIPYTSTMDDIKYLKIETMEAPKRPFGRKYKCIEKWDDSLLEKTEE